MQMINIKLYLLLLAVATGVMGDRPEKVVSGSYTSPTEIPYIVSLRTGFFHFCGGSIISYYHILTAAHCLYQSNPQGSPFKPGQSYVVTGTTMKKSNGTSHVIKSITVHPYFRMEPQYMLKYDIAIVTLNNKIEMNEHQKIIRLPVSPVPRKSAGIASGWGDQFFRQQYGSDMLLKIETTVMHGEECYYYRPFDQDTQSIICALVESGRVGGTCQGDSGGPLVVDNTLVGVVSNGEGCAAGRPDIFTSVYFYKSWIEQAVNLTGLPGVTKDTPESDFYKKDEATMKPMKCFIASRSPNLQIAYYAYNKDEGEMYAVLH